MELQSTEKSNPSAEKDCAPKGVSPQEIRVTVETANPKPASPKWWDLLGWILRFAIALATLLKLLKDKD